MTKDNYAVVGGESLEDLIKNTHDLGFKRAIKLMQEWFKEYSEHLSRALEIALKKMAEEKKKEIDGSDFDLTEEIGASQSDMVNHTLALIKDELQIFSQHAIEKCGKSVQVSSVKDINENDYVN